MARTDSFCLREKKEEENLGTARVFTVECMGVWAECDRMCAWTRSSLYPTVYTQSAMYPRQLTKQWSAFMNRSS